MSWLITKTSPGVHLVIFFFGSDRIMKALASAPCPTEGVIIWWRFWDMRKPTVGSSWKKKALGWGYIPKVSSVSAQREPLILGSLLLSTFWPPWFSRPVSSSQTSYYDGVFHLRLRALEPVSQGQKPLKLGAPHQKKCFFLKLFFSDILWQWQTLTDFCVFNFLFTVYIKLYNKKFSIIPVAMTIL